MNAKRDAKTDAKTKNGIEARNKINLRSRGKEGDGEDDEAFPHG